MFHPKDLTFKMSSNNLYNDDSLSSSMFIGVCLRELINAFYYVFFQNGETTMFWYKVIHAL